jgi:hypothetical protein
MVRIRDFSYIREKVFVIMVAQLVLFMVLNYEISDSIPGSASRFPVLPAIAFAPRRVSSMRGDYESHPRRRNAVNKPLWVRIGRGIYVKEISFVIVRA